MLINTQGNNNNHSLLPFPLIDPLKLPFHILLKLPLHKTPLRLPRLIPNLLREAPRHPSELT